MEAIVKQFHWGRSGGAGLSHAVCDHTLALLPCKGRKTLPAGDPRRGGLSPLCTITLHGAAGAFYEVGGPVCKIIIWALSL